MTQRWTGKEKIAPPHIVWKIGKYRIIASVVFERYSNYYLTPGDGMTHSARLQLNMEVKKKNALGEDYWSSVEKYFCDYALMENLAYSGKGPFADWTSPNVWVTPIRVEPKRVETESKGPYR